MTSLTAPCDGGLGLASVSSSQRLRQRYGRFVTSTERPLGLYFCGWGALAQGRQQRLGPRLISQGMAVTEAEFGAMKEVNGPEIALLRTGRHAAP
jgi:hypothetical protein